MHQRAAVYYTGGINLFRRYCANKSIIQSTEFKVKMEVMVLSDTPVSLLTMHVYCEFSEMGQYIQKLIREHGQSLNAPN